MNLPTPITIASQQCWLSGEKAIFWEEEKTLILSDLHLGKTGHFRKAGIAVPSKLYQNDLHRLMQVIQHFQPNNIIIVGDLTHSHENNELDLFIKWRNDLKEIDMVLVKGNHDILKDEWYQKAGLLIHNSSFEKGPYRFVHQPDTEQDDAHLFTFSGHLHPGVVVKGLGKQSLRFPCFLFSHKLGLLPAFSEFTGTALVDVGSNDKIFAIVDKKIIPLQ